MALTNAERQARHKERLYRLATEARPVIVRVFIPAPEDDDADYLGEEMPFLAVPRVGEEIRHFSRDVRYRVIKTGHLEEDARFVPAIWVEIE